MWNFIEKYWDKFINGYCKVDFLCYNGEPNWLGWIPLIGIGIVICFSIVFGLLAAIEQEILGRKIETINKKEEAERKKQKIASEGYNLY